MDDLYANVLLNSLFAIYYLNFVSIFALANREGVVSFRIDINFHNL